MRHTLAAIGLFLMSVAAVQPAVSQTPTLAGTWKLNAKESDDAKEKLARATESRLLSSWSSYHVVDGHGPETVVVGRVYRTSGTFRDREIDAVTTETMILRRAEDGILRIHHIHWSSRKATPTDGPP